MTALGIFKIFAMVLSVFAAVFCFYSGIKNISEGDPALGSICIILAITNTFLFVLNAVYFLGL